MVVSQTDWIPSGLRLNLWGRLSLFLFSTIVIIIIIVSIQEYLNLNLGEHFSNLGKGLGLVPTDNAKSYFPLNFILPAEYLRPKLDQKNVSSATIHHLDSLTTRNRFI